MQRRNFLGLSAGIVGAAAAGSIYYRRHGLLGSLPFTTSAQVGRLGAGLDTVLDVTSRSINLGGRPVTVFTYNNLFPGPPISVHAGDSVRIRLNNRLAEPTNLHFHGLHVPPEGRADNVFLEVPEGESATYTNSWFRPIIRRGPSGTTLTSTGAPLNRFRWALPHPSSCAANLTKSPKWLLQRNTSSCYRTFLVPAMA